MVQAGPVEQEQNEIFPLPLTEIDYAQRFN